jgi:hypothetical protein
MIEQLLVKKERRYDLMKTTDLQTQMESNDYNFYALVSLLKDKTLKFKIFETI